jgi:hypothetical protein
MRDQQLNESIMQGEGEVGDEDHQQPGRRGRQADPGLPPRDGECFAAETSHP